MIDWWNSLELAGKILWAVTLSASLVFVIQTVMTFLGASSDTDFDINADIDTGGDVGSDSHPGSGMNLLTFRNLVNFMIGFGWTAILLQEDISSLSVLLLVSTIVGVTLVALVMLLFKWLTGMQQSGTINVYKLAIDCQGTVYLTIPGERSGEGKIQITINNSVREYTALTDGPTLKTGTRIRVVDVINASTLLVEEINSIII